MLQDDVGNIALHWAAYSGSRANCHLLLDYKSDVNATNEAGDTPM